VAHYANGRLEERRGGVLNRVSGRRPTDGGGKRRKRKSGKSRPSGGKTARQPRSWKSTLTLARNCEGAQK